MGRVTVLAGLCALLLLGSCARPADDVPPVPAEAGAAAATPTAACPIVPDQTLPEGCAPYDGEASMRLNDAHEVEREPQQDALAAAQEAQPRAEAALAGLLESDEPLTPTRARSALDAAGFDRDQIQASQAGPWDEPNPDILAVGISFDGACLNGGVRRDAPEGPRVRMEAGGTYLDGPCLVPMGH